ncbi:MA3 domain-containing protein [Ditylenchus destructor]|uniref:MA3 domain-containing protein n=1 Tax=Ditylenchus destructor TaxID=166010 RepID=A0AAD4NKP7_9BILA|nr:MA3 domain-containing protein [Ditylenchus destructor]
MEDRDFGPLLNVRCTRKELRKMKKKLKPTCNAAFSKHQKVDTAIKERFNDKKAKKRAKRKRQAENKRQKAIEKEDEPEDLKTFLKEAEKVREQRMLDEMNQDELEIKRLEKKISAHKSKKRKTEEEDAESLERFLDNNELSDSSNLEENFDDEIAAAHSDQDDASENPGIPNRTLANFDPLIVKLAKRAKMDTKLRQYIFCTIMSSSDSAKACAELLELNLKGTEEREIIRVCFECIMLEKEYNPYYVVIVKTFCSANKQFQITAQFVSWDLLKALNSLKDHQRSHLSYALADLLKHQSLGLSVLRVMNFGELNNESSTFLKILLYRFLINASESVIRENIMKVINSAKKDNRFAEGLQLFFEQPIAELIPDSFKTEETQSGTENLMTFKKRLAMVKRLWSVV